MRFVSPEFAAVFRIVLKKTRKLTLKQCRKEKFIMKYISFTAVISIY